MSFNHYFNAVRLLIMLVTVSSFSVSAQENEKEVFNISSDYELLIKKIEQQRLLTKMDQYDQFIGGLKKVKENLKVKAHLAEPLQKELPPEQLYQLRKAGVLMIGSFYDCGRCEQLHTAISATAVVISADGICVTNYHVFKSMGLGKRPDTAIMKRHLYISDIDGDTFPIQEILTYSEAGDVAIFKVSLNGAKLTPIPLGESAMVASNVHAISHPKGKELYYYSKGSVARKTQNAGNPMLDRMYVSCEYAVGSSGGPILDNKGNLVGLISTTRPLYTAAKDPMHLQMVLRGVIPILTIQSLIN